MNSIRTYNRILPIKINTFVSLVSCINVELVGRTGGGVVVVSIILFCLEDDSCI